MSPRVDVVERVDAQDAMTLDPETLDPKMHYRFCHPRVLGRRRSEGYEPVKRSETGVRLLNDPEGYQSADDLVHFGHLVLMMCAKSTFSERRKRGRQVTEARLNSSEKQFAEKARKRGVKTVTGDEGE
jgi:hypothetical protein